MEMKKITTVNKLMYGTLALLLINALIAFFTGIWQVLQSGCDERCVSFSLFLVAWGVVGLLSGVLILKKYLVAIWGGCLFFLLQALGISASGFSYNLNIGLNLFISVGGERSLIFFNLLALAAIIIMISTFVAEYQKGEAS